MTLIANTLKSSVTDYCARIGADPMLVQGAGGNVSWKDEDILWIKASGTWLADAKVKDIFVPVDLTGLQSAIKESDFAVTPKLKRATLLKPSIETLLHALMPHRVVVHLHAIEPLAHLIRHHSAFEISNKLKADVNWKIVGYQKPGEALAKSIADAIEGCSSVNTVLLENHGVVIGGADVEEVNNHLNVLLSMLSAPPNAITCDSPIPEPIEISGDVQYIPVDIADIHGLVFEPELFDRIKTDWALYPDHVVFLGRSPVCYDSVQLLIEDARSSRLPELVFVKGLGVFAKPGFSLAKLVQLKCYYDVLVRQTKDIQLRVLDEQQTAELLSWDAEHYRQHVAKRNID